MNKTEKVNPLHEEAMTIADKAFLAERAKDGDKAIELYQQVFEIEKQAAMMMVLDWEVLQPLPKLEIVDKIFVLELF